ncbi:hypothetical protein SAMD00019534_011700, partial [Acytostelium subglobosum LB1]|uniref:hypothetical protein n=1 Tax=Acytostelium subglobosum LB1 TaxID=1410327 RepID=UPI000645069B
MSGIIRFITPVNRMLSMNTVQRQTGTLFMNNFMMQTQMPINVIPEQQTQQESFETVMNKTSRKTLKKHRKRINGTRSNMSRC